MKNYQIMAYAIQAIKFGIDKNRQDIIDKNEKTITDICDSFNGSGIHNFMANLEKSNDREMPYEFDYHYMNDNGYYDSWYKYHGKIQARLSCGFDFSIVGSNRNMIKEFLGDTLHEFLNSEI